MICPRCHGLCHEDIAFTAAVRAYNCPQRRYACLNGHSVYVGLPPLEPPSALPVRMPGYRPRTERQCPQCGDAFRGVKRQRYCGTDCMRAADRARRAAQAYSGKRLAPEELRLARSMPRPWNSWKRNGTAPRAYATRPTNLSKAWV